MLAVDLLTFLMYARRFEILLLVTSSIGKFMIINLSSFGKLIVAAALTVPFASFAQTQGSGAAGATTAAAGAGLSTAAIIGIAVVTLAVVGAAANSSGTTGTK